MPTAEHVRSAARNEEAGQAEHRTLFSGVPGCMLSAAICEDGGEGEDAGSDAGPSGR
jgi:hypothetical protein